MTIIACLVCHSETGLALKNAFWDTLSTTAIFGVLLPFFILFLVVGIFHLFESPFPYEARK